MRRNLFTFVLVFGFGLSVFAQTESSSCPAIDVTGGGVVARNEPKVFFVSVSDEDKYPRLEYLWTVSTGEIIQGQGTKSIKVDVTDIYDENVTATVEIKGLPDNCTKIISETGSPIERVYARSFDEFGAASNGRVKDRIENFYTELTAFAGAQCYIINYGTDKEIRAREKQIRNALNSGAYDPSRVTLLRGGANPNGAGVWTKIWIVPPGADFPEP